MSAGVGGILKNHLSGKAHMKETLASKMWHFTMYYVFRISLYQIEQQPALKICIQFLSPLQHVSSFPSLGRVAYITKHHGYK